jgi:hypothetical protein
VLVPEEEIPLWGHRKTLKSRTRTWVSTVSQQRHSHKEIATAARAKPAALYVLTAYLSGGPISPKFANKITSRTIEIRGDQTLEDLHLAIFQAYDRWVEHLYEFQLGKRPFDSAGPNYGITDPDSEQRETRDASTTTLDSLGLKPERAFGYWFDFGDDWYHQVQVDRIEQAIPTVTYPRVIKRIGKSPPQYGDE